MSAVACELASRLLLEVPRHVQATADRRYAAPIGEFFFSLVLSLESSRTAAVRRFAACSGLSSRLVAAGSGNRDQVERYTVGRWE